MRLRGVCIQGIEFAHPCAAECAGINNRTGAATFFTARVIGRLSDSYGRQKIFCVLSAVLIAPILFLTFMPNLPYLAVLAIFPVFMVLMSTGAAPTKPQGIEEKAAA